MPRPEIVEEARSWVGTPFRHHQGTRGVGADGWHFVRGVGEALGLLQITPEAWAPFHGYAPQPSGAVLRSILDAFLAPLEPEAAEIGDVVLLGDQADAPTDLGILAERGARRYLIRASVAGEGRFHLTGAPAVAVAEHGFIAPWPRRALRWYRYPGAEGL